MRIWRIAQDFDLAERVTKEVYRLQATLAGRKGVPDDLMRARDMKRRGLTIKRISRMISGELPYISEGEAHALAVYVVENTEKKPAALVWIRDALDNATNHYIGESGVMTELTGEE